jgi:hypothetical protein
MRSYLASCVSPATSFSTKCSIRGAISFKSDSFTVHSLRELLKLEGRSYAHVLLGTESSIDGNRSSPKRPVEAIEELCLAVLEAAEQRDEAPLESNR